MPLDDSIHGCEHADSYYAATQRDTTPFAALEQDISADVCIVGGGLSGVATAVELSEAGLRVVLLEAHRIGWGASGRNGGQVIGGYASSLGGTPAQIDKRFGEGAHQHLIAMNTECVDIIHQRVKKYGIACDLKRGYIDVAMKGSEVRDLREWQAELHERDYPYETEWVGPADIASVVGSDRYIGGLINKGYGHVHVLDLCKGEARAAESRGAQIFEQSKVIDLQPGQPCVVKTARGSVTAEVAVLCGNAYLRQLSPQLAPKISPYLFPASSYVIATAPLGDALAASVMPRDYAVCDQRTALDYFRLSADKRMLFGGMSNYTARDPRSISATMGKSMHAVFPQLKDVRIEYEWGGHMGIGINRVPQVGRVSENIYYAQAYSGHGVAPTHMSARLIAEAVQQRPERFDILAKVSHIPLPGGLKLGQSLMALGMLYYKLRDRLG